MAATTAARITTALTEAGAPLSLAALAEELDLATNPVRMALRRLTLAGTVVRIDTEGDLTRWALPAAEVAEVAAPAEEEATEAPAEAAEEEGAEAAAPALPEACHCGDDAVGHVHPRQIAAAPKAGKGQGGAGRRAEAWARAVEALRAAGPEGLSVPEVWEATGLAHQPAYTLVNEHKDELVIVVASRKVRERRVALASA